MHSLRPDPFAGTGAPTAEVRRHGRFRCNMLNSTLGEVLDISAAGLRVRHRGALRAGVGDCVPLTIALASSEIRVDVRIVWMRRTGFRRQEIGMEFINLDAASRSCLSDVARCAAGMAAAAPQAA